MLLPFLSSTAEQITAVIVSYKNRTDLAVAVCIGGIMQTIYFVTPMLVLISAATHHPLTLYFGRWETVAVILASVLLVALLQKGTSTYFDGILCLGLYSIVVIAIFALPEEVLPSERGAAVISVQSLSAAKG